jgi:hypothetical protein
MDKSYYDADFESVLKDFEKNSTLKNKGVKTDDDFDTKYKRQEVGITDKKTGKTTPPFDRATPDTFLKRRLKLSGPIGAAATVGALAGVALEKGINKIKSMKEKDAKPTPSDVEGKAKGGYVKKQYRMYNGKF